VAVDLPAEKVSLQQVRDWLSRQFGHLVPLGVSDSFGEHGQVTASYDEVITDQCPRHGLFSYSEVGRRVGGMQFALVSRPARFITQAPENVLRINHDLFNRDGWQYWSCHK
jgi:hypothetical protein